MCVACVACEVCVACVACVARVACVACVACGGSAAPLERHTIPSAELIVAATMLTRQSPATNIPAAAGPGQREEGSDQSGASWRRPLIG